MIEGKLKELFEVNSQMKDLKARAAELQQDVNAYSDEHISDFVDGQLTLESGVIKIQQNPPKLVHLKSEKTVSTADRELFTDDLDKDYVQRKPNLAKIAARVNGDKVLKKQLQAKGYAVVQDSRYSAKPY